MRTQIFLFSIILCLNSVTAWALRFDDDVDAEVREQVLKDLKFAASIEGSHQSALHEEIFGNVSGRDYDQFFQSRVADLGVGGCSSSAAIACVIPAVDSSKIWLNGNYFKFDVPQIARVMVLYHEARHTEKQNGFWSHARCPKPFLDADGNPVTSMWTGLSMAGALSCDSTPYGSYGSALILLKNIAKFCENCSQKVKTDAHLYADGHLDRIADPQAKDQILKDLYES